jgi:4-hydroxythreonine-4-phosphate dehydrogenase
VNYSRILITSGEPAGIGPDLIAAIAQEKWEAELSVIGDEKLLLERALRLKLPLKLLPFDETVAPEPLAAGSLKLIPVALNQACEAGQLNKENASYVKRCLEKAAQLALANTVDALVTAPVHKGILNEAGLAFQGHTEFFAAYAGLEKAVMLFVVKSPLTTSFRNGSLKVALVTTHLPLAAVPDAITAKALEFAIRSLHQALITQFAITKPRILVAGLNPHAGEDGYLGQEEKTLITPVLEKLRQEGKELVGPLSADTLFTEKFLSQADAVLAMYHDQALPVVKSLGFGKGVNVTLGLPFIRTSVDHGTALDVAGTKLADASSLKAALHLAIDLAQKKKT